MAYETVTGYCWPQSVEAGQTVGAAPLLGRRAAGAGRGGPGGRPARRRAHATTAVTAGDHPTPLDAAQLGCGWPAALDARRRGRAGAAATTRSSSRSTSTARRRREHAFFVVRPAGRRAHRADPAGAGHQHLARLQRLRRPQPLHGRHLRVAPAADGPGLPAQAAGQRPPGHHVSRAPDPEMHGPRRLPAPQPPLALRRVGGLARLGAAVPRSGPSARATPSTS